MNNWSRICECYYGRVSEYVLLNMFVVAENVDAIRAFAESKGEVATFWTFTYAVVLAYAVDVQHWRKFLSRLRRAAAGLCGVRTFEWGGRKGRFHAHGVLDREVPKAVIEKCERGTNLGFTWAERVNDEGGAYLYKELAKQFGRRGQGRRLWGTFGKFPGRMVLRDVELVSRAAECRRLAWAAREYKAEPHFRTWERAKFLYQHTDVGRAEVEERIRSAAEVLGLWEGDIGGDKVRCAVIRRGSGSGVVHGDAWEEAGGSVEFDPKEYQS
ncbi:MAG TPA: hypothetical protein VMV72_17070 [Verrucomicrobiae bacterium]|nr:hypothetical protein [Verrucomicrobiae bacterium]